jgi:hypothetical protein
MGGAGEEVEWRGIDFPTGEFTVFIASVLSFSTCYTYETFSASRLYMFL